MYNKYKEQKYEAISHINKARHLLNESYHALCSDNIGIVRLQRKKIDLHLKELDTFLQDLK